MSIPDKWVPILLEMASKWGHGVGLSAENSVVAFSCVQLVFAVFALLERFFQLLS